MTQFILTVEGDHAKLTANGLVVYESGIGTLPPPAPLPTPTPTPTPSDPCTGVTDPRVLQIIAEGKPSHLGEFLWRVGRTATDQEHACLVSKGIFKPAHYQSSPGGPRPTDIGWTPGAPIVQRAQSATYNVRPSPEWLEQEAHWWATGQGSRPRLEIITAESSYAPPTSVSISILGKRHMGGPVHEKWSTRDPDFPKITGSFQVRIDLWDQDTSGNRIPAEGKSIVVQMQR